MSSSRKPTPPSLTRNASLAERSLNRKTSFGFRSPVRRISDPGFDRFRNSAITSDDLRSSSRFPKLVFSSGKKKVQGVVNLNTVCERKYRSWSDPIEYTQAMDIWDQSGTFNRDFNSTRAFFSRLEREMNETKDNFEEKSFCDSVSSFPCSSITRNSVCSPVITDEREVSISKHKSVLNWIHSFGRTN